MVGGKKHSELTVIDRHRGCDYLVAIFKKGLEEQKSECRFGSNLKTVSKRVGAITVGAVTKIHTRRKGGTEENDNIA